jgi:hypothetical protein
VVSVATFKMATTKDDLQAVIAEIESAVVTIEEGQAIK